MIGRAGSRAETLHFLHQEGQQRALILYGCLGHRIKIGFIGRATAFCNHHKSVFSSFGSFDVNLRGKIAFRVHFVIHIERSVLGIAQIVLCKRVVNASRECLFIFKTRPHLLSLLAVDDGRTGILAER